MLPSFLRRLRHPARVVRGGPRFVAGPPLGPHGVVAWIPEGRVVGQRVVPTAIIELHATGVRRRRLGSARPTLIAVAGGAALGGLLAYLFIRRFAR